MFHKLYNKQTKVKKIFHEKTKGCHDSYKGGSVMVSNVEECEKVIRSQLNGEMME